ncbi:MAG: PepSY domain-containing protein, partial [Woeseiaceae bacterium]
MKNVLYSIAIVGLAWSSQSFATGLATCDSGSEDTWRPQEELKEQLVKKGWDVRRIKIDGGCY